MRKASAPNIEDTPSAMTAGRCAGGGACSAEAAGRLTRPRCHRRRAAGWLRHPVGASILSPAFDVRSPAFARAITFIAASRGDSVDAGWVRATLRAARAIGLKFKNPNAPAVEREAEEDLAEAGAFCGSNLPSRLPHLLFGRVSVAIGHPSTAATGRWAASTKNVARQSTFVGSIALEQICRINIPALLRGMHSAWRNNLCRPSKSSCIMNGPRQFVFDFRFNGARFSPSKTCNRVKSGSP
jgi:hypothetical protein